MLDEPGKICSEDTCVGCGACAAGCPQSCITIKEDAEGFLFPYIHTDACIHCGLCSRLCPQNQAVQKQKSTFYMSWHKDDAILMESSSGGVFTAVADWVLKRNGIVVGAAFDRETREVYHTIVESSQQLSRLRLSKYYQSRTSQIFPDVKTAIKKETLVLFSGTACQIAAMKSYLGSLANSEYLLTFDILCHGTANKKTVEAYLHDRERQYHKTITDFRFRIKEGQDGWQLGSGTRMKLFFDDGTSQAQNKYLDTYFVGFNSNIFLRECCYRCRYCGQERISDFTAADFWGVKEEKVGKEQLYKGVSVLLVNSQRAEKMLDDLREDLVLEEIAPSEAIPFNRAFTEPNRRPEARSRFFPMMEKKGFDKAVKTINRKYYTKKYIREALTAILPGKTMERILQKRR